LLLSQFEWFESVESLDLLLIYGTNRNPVGGDCLPTDELAVRLAV